MGLAERIEMEADWKRVLSEELEKPYMLQLAGFLNQERLSETPIYPEKKLVFNAFQQTPYDKVKVVIVGQDPYHGPGQAHGLSFSVPKGVKSPPSLQNIFKELVADVGIEMPQHGCLVSWAQQGVLLLNAVLTVRGGQPMSHRGQGWESFTDAVILKLAERADPVIFVLWGKFAQEKVFHLNQLKEKTLKVLTAAHPSPFSAANGFFGCRHFSKINQWLMEQGKNPIDWSLQS